MRKHRQRTETPDAVTPTAPRVRGRRIATAIVRHAAPLVALVMLDNSIDTYLMLVLFDLGVGYAGHQLRHRGMTTRFALEAAETFSERLFARLQLPMMMALGGALFIGTALLFLFPFLWPRMQVAFAADTLAIVASATVMSLTGAWQLDSAMATGNADSPAFRAAADRGAGTVLGLLGLFLLIALYAIALGGADRGMWLLATAFAGVHCAADLGWRLSRR